MLFQNTLFCIFLTLRVKFILNKKKCKKILLIQASWFTYILNQYRCRHKTMNCRQKLSPSLKKPFFPYRNKHFVHSLSHQMNHPKSNTKTFTSTTRGDKQVTCIKDSRVLFTPKARNKSGHTKSYLFCEKSYIYTHYKQYFSITFGKMFVCANITTPQLKFEY